MIIEIALVLLFFILVAMLIYSHKNNAELQKSLYNKKTNRELLATKSYMHIPKEEAMDIINKSDLTKTTQKNGEKIVMRMSLFSDKRHKKNLLSMKIRLFVFCLKVGVYMSM